VSGRLPAIPDSRPRPPRRRRLLFALAAALIVFAFTELLSCVGWWMTTGSFFSYAKATALRDAARDMNGRLPGETDQDAAARQALRGANAMHPYLGYVFRYEGYTPAGGEPINRFGFIDSDDPLRKRSPDRYIVGITGGSVAAQVSLYTAEVLAAEIGKSAALAGRRVEFVRMALGGYRQPQGVAALAYVLNVGGEFDCVVNIDGFNEVAFAGPNVEQGVPSYFPQNWASMAVSTLPREKQILIGRLLDLREQRASFAALGDAFGWTATGQVVWLLRDRSLASAVAAANDAVEHYKLPAKPYDVTGPLIGGASVQDALGEMAGVWARSSELMHAICASRGIRYFHFLQPNQYVPGSKPIGDEERKIAIWDRHPWRDGVERGYPLLAERFEELREHGVAFRDLRRLFVDHPEPLYRDPCCHLNRTGYTILATAIASTIRQHLDLEGAELTELRAEPAVLQIADPTQPASLRVIGARSGGGEIDVTGMPATELLPVDPAVIDIDASGQVVALRRGTTSLRVRCRGREVSVPVRCEWPRVVTGNDGMPRDGRLPVLAVFDAGQEGSAAALRLRDEDCPAGLLGTLLVSLRPIPVVPGEQGLLATCTILPLVPVDGAATVDFPLPRSVGQSMLHLRAVFVDLAQRRVATTSRAVVVTLD